MKITAESFVEMLKDNGITCSINEEHVMLNGGDKKLLTKLYELLDTKPEFKSGVIRYLNSQSNMSLDEYLTALEGAGVKIELDTWFELHFTGSKEKARLRFINILETDNRLKACVMLSLAVRDKNLLDMVKERACIRWENGYSDSLVMALMSSFAVTGEVEKRDDNGQIILQPKTDWENEIANL